MPKVRKATCQHHLTAWKAPQWCCQDDRCGGSPNNQCTSTSTFHNTVQKDGTAPQGCWAPGITATMATLATTATTATPAATPATVTATSITTGNPIYMVACDSKHGTDHIGWQCSSIGPTCFGDPRSVSSCAAVERFLSNNGYDDCKCHPDVADCKGGACNDKKGDCINLEPGPSTRGVVAYPLMPWTTYSWNNPKGKEVTGGSCIDQAENHEAKFDRITTWSHLVVDLDTLQVQADSTAYATHLVGEGINGSTYLQLGYARSCSSSNLGNAVIDQRGSPFAITGEESCTCAVPQETPCICGQWTSKGWNNQMELKCTENNQRCVVRCGGQTGNCELTNGYLQLEYVAKTNDEYYASTKELEEECEVASVSCGNHVAPTCGECAPVHISGTDLSRYCNGICAWHNNKCILKSQATTTASTTSVTTPTTTTTTSTSTSTTTSTCNEDFTGERCEIKVESSLDSAGNHVKSYSDSVGTKKVYSTAPEKGFLSWEDARAHCKTQSTPTLSVDLVAFETQEEEANVRNMFNLFGKEFWIGCNDLVSEGNTEGSFSWAGQGSKLSCQKNEPGVYSNWKGGERNNYYASGEHCAVVETNGFWNDEQCNRKHGFICEKSTTTTTTTTSTATTTATTTTTSTTTTTTATSVTTSTTNTPPPPPPLSKDNIGRTDDGRKDNGSSAESSNADENTDINNNIDDTTSSAGMVAGIVVGVVATIAIAIAAVICKKRKQGQAFGREKGQPATNNPAFDNANYAVPNLPSNAAHSGLEDQTYSIPNLPLNNNNNGGTVIGTSIDAVYSDVADQNTAAPASGDVVVYNASDPNMVDYDVISPATVLEGTVVYDAAAADGQTYATVNKGGGAAAAEPSYAVVDTNRKSKVVTSDMYAAVSKPPTSNAIEADAENHYDMSAPRRRTTSAGNTKTLGAAAAGKASGENHYDMAPPRRRTASSPSATANSANTAATAARSRTGTGTGTMGKKPVPEALRCQRPTPTGGRCKNKKVGKSQFCKGHTCNADGCTETKSSSANFCATHIAGAGADIGGFSDDDDDVFC